MKSRIAFFFRYLSLFSFLLALSGCAGLPGAGSPDGESAGEDPEVVGEIEERVVVESEDALREELAALDQLGEWDGGPPELATPQYDFPVVTNKQVEFYLKLFQGKQRNHFARWLSRSNQYLTMIHPRLREAGLPLDLAYLAMIESGFNPTAYSHAHASGLWQFIQSTGRNYGLRVDGWVDERRDPEKATEAAIAYLTDLYNEFDDWYLAVAGYNAGEGKIRRAIARYDSRDFWHLAGKRYLRLETKRYVPKLIAAIIIAKEPEKYGFANIEFEKAPLVEEVEVPPLTALDAVALCCNTDVSVLKKMNNQLRKGMTPPDAGGYSIKVPLGAKALVAKNLSRIHPVIATDFKTHVVRKGETLSSICKRYHLNKTTLLKANKLRSAQLIAGNRLRIPFRSTKYVLLGEGQSPRSFFASNSDKGALVLHQIRSGDTISKISKQYQVPAEMIMSWNGLASIHKIRAGQQLALYLGGGESSPPEVLGADFVPSLSAGDIKKRVTYYRVRNGDSLWAIARKFQVSTSDIMQWNDLNSNMIRPGRKLIVKKG